MYVFLKGVNVKKCIFLDRDGNINVEVDYLHKPEDFKFIDGVEKAIKIFNNLGYLVIVVTNQSGVARGYYNEEDVLKLHEHINGELKKTGGKVDGYYYCPHHPNGVEVKYRKKCLCRKPELGMFLEAKKDFDIDFEHSFIVGDKLSDIESGLRLGMESVLVRSGHGKEEEKKLYSKTLVFDSLYDFALSFSKMS